MFFILLMATTLLLIRHGQTAWNAARRIQGQLDEPLSQIGREQAQQLALYLAEVPLHAVVTSDLARARETALPLAQRRGLKLEVDARLRERHFGIFEGQLYSDLERQQSADWLAFQSRDPDWQIPHGESLAQLSTRVLTALTELVSKSERLTIAVVTHGGALEAIYRAARGLAWSAPRDFALPNAGVSRVRATSNPLALEVLSWAEVSYLHHVSSIPISP